MLKRYKKSTLRIRKETMLGFSSMALSLLIALALICPLAQDDSYATCADGTGGSVGESCTSTMAEIDTEVNVNTSISIAVDAKMGLDLTPSSNGTTSTASGKVLVATNSIDGYALFMKASNGLTNTSTVNSATSTKEGSSLVNTISNLSANSTLANMPMNTYGYNLSNTLPSEVEATTSTYLPLDTTGSNAIRRTSFSTGSSDSTSSSNSSADTDYGYGDSFYLNLGVKVGNSLPAGTYAGTITLSAVANPLTVKSMAGLTYMQDMTSEICANTREHYTKQLIDVRDGNSYWVAKLKDGNCWMTQNLALDITDSMANAEGNNGLLNSTTTDIGYDNNGNLIDGIKYWNSGSTYKPVATTTQFPISHEYSDSSSVTYSFNPGKWVAGTPELISTCSTELKAETLEACKYSGAVNVDDGWSPTFTAQEMTWNGPQVLQERTNSGNSNPGSGTPLESYTGLISVDYNSKTYDSHYLLGNYYTHNAATAGSGVSDTVYTAPDSICPKGWKLPNGTAKDLNDTASGYGYLVKQYVPFSDNKYPVTRTLLGNPLYITRFGRIMRYNNSKAIISVFGYASYFQVPNTIPNPNRLNYVIGAANIWGDNVDINYNFNIDNPENRGQHPKIAASPMRCIAR